MVEREWREASDLRTSRMALAVVLIAAAVLRFWAIRRGIPYAVQVDEPEIVERAVNMMRSGSLHPHFFDYPGLSLYVQLVVSIVRFIAGAIGGEWSSLAQAAGGSFYLWGRFVTAAFGVATVLLVYQAGMRWGARHALLASGLMAVLPLHVRYSHYVLTDTPLTFFVALTFLLSLVAHERGTLGSFVAAGAAAGLAAATKYNGGVALIMVAADFDATLSDSILRAAGNGEHDPEGCVAFLARGRGVSFPVALLVKEGADSLDRILDQILIDGRIASDRNQFCALLFR